MVQLLNRLAVSATWLIALSSLLGFSGRYSRWFDHFSNFRVQYFLLGSVLALWYFFRRQHRLAVLNVLIFVGNGWYVVSWFFVSQSTSAAKADFRIYHANVLYKNRDFGPVTQQIREETPDFFFINEATPPLIAHLTQKLGNEYPYSFYVYAKNATRVFVGSRVPIRIDSAATFAFKGLIKFITVVNNKPLTIIACHAYNPLKKEDFGIRNRQLKYITALVEKEHNPTLVVGDLNITPWSVFYEDLIKESGLHNCRQGFGLNPSWPTWVPPMLIPIDHCLINHQLETIGFRTGRYNKSDHLPLVIELRFR